MKKNLLKLIILIIAIVAVVMLFVSCKKEETIEPEYKGTTYFRVESVEKDGTKNYSNISRITIR